MLPANFTVGSNINHRRGGGHLVIDHRRLALEPGALGVRVSDLPTVVQTSPDVTLVRPRLGLPWMNVSVVVKGDGNVGVATTWFGARRRLVSTLREAGFNVNESRPWVSIGEIWRYSR